MHTPGYLKLEPQLGGRGWMLVAELQYLTVVELGAAHSQRLCNNATTFGNPR